MCGIVGYVGPRPVVDVLLEGLQRLEYRGYDSAGVAYWNQASIEIRKSAGKLENVTRLLPVVERPAHAGLQYGIGHTRWATHGKPTTQNAHPHRTGHVVLVHNGIIENFEEIRDEILADGFHPESETDSELFGFLVLRSMDRGLSLQEAVRQNFLRLRGTSALVVLSEREPGVIVGVRNGLPLIAAGDQRSSGVFLASDAQAVLAYTKQIYFLEDGDLVVLGREGIRFFEVSNGKEVQRPVAELNWTADQIDKQGYPHFMLKEIFDQPVAAVDTFNSLLDRARADPFPLAAQPGVEILQKAESLTLVACGTAWHSACLGKYWIERWARIPVQVELASEYRYREPVVRKGEVIVGISQSGETADTLAVIREMRGRGVPTLAVTNVRGSSIAREAGATFFMSAGPEIGVAATKTFFTQMLTLLLWAGLLGLRTGSEQGERLKSIFDEVLKIPHQVDALLRGDHGSWVTQVRDIGRRLGQDESIKGYFFIGRGYNYILSLEGALKLKEIAYLNAEGYAAGELKHGPIAMLDPQVVVVGIIPTDHWREKTISNLQEAKARGARLLGIGAANDKQAQALCEAWIPIPAINEDLMPFLIAPALQLLSYEIALSKGTDVDKPRNLAKSVTVE